MFSVFSVKQTPCFAAVKNFGKVRYVFISFIFPYPIQEKALLKTKVHAKVHYTRMRVRKEVLVLCKLPPKRKHFGIISCIVRYQKQVLRAYVKAKPVNTPPVNNFFWQRIS